MWNLYHLQVCTPSFQVSADTPGSPHAQTRLHPAPPQPPLPRTPASQPRNAVGGTEGRLVQTLLLD